MSSVYPPGESRSVRSFPLGSFIRASSLHVGAAAAAAALRRDLVESGQVASSEFDEAYAMARLTPGTNLLAMYLLLGRRLGGWRGASITLSVGAFVPSVIAVLFGAAYFYARHPLADRAMQGARAGALAVFAWAIVRLIRPQFEQHGTRGVILALSALVATLVLPVPPFAVLLIAGGLGAMFLRRDP